ncbi:MAG: SPOR domain-containing protein [Rhodocyclaceae bacterium]
MAKQISGNKPPAPKPAAPPPPAPDLKGKLVWRMGFAGLMIVMLLGTLALFDYLSAPEEPESATPRFSEPVPVQKKDVTQPVKPAEPPPEVPAEVRKEPEPEATAAPTGQPAPPEVTAQPALPRAQPHAQPRAETRTLPLSRPQPSSQLQSPAQPQPGMTPRPAPLRPAIERPAAEAEAPAVRTQVAPAGGSTIGGRLFSGYALQAGVFSDVRRAEELHAKLTLNGIPSTLEARVQVGPFKTREEAELAREKMKVLGIDAVLLMPPKGAVR